MKTPQDIIIRPVITEASMEMTENKKYVFRVHPDANKPEIADAIEKLFGVKVKSVNTMVVKGKPRRVRYAQGYTSTWKKAIVTLTEDSKPIEFFEGMR
ncbi:MAG TPA: 50S ribosomal protein L23 [Bacillota bacterium]|nr:50S ribosomal protein L23 [Clostridiales bacterium]HPT85812.1 50S ribosomal protein L23 [Bacillota bacterium]